MDGKILVKCLRFFLSEKLYIFGYAYHFVVHNSIQNSNWQPDLFNQHQSNNWYTVSLAVATSQKPMHQYLLSLGCSVPYVKCGIFFSKVIATTTFWPIYYHLSSLLVFGKTGKHFALHHDKFHKAIDVQNKENSS